MIMKLLVALDSSDYAYKVVNYVASAVRPDVQITLFSVLDSSISTDMQEQLHYPQFQDKVDYLSKAEVGKASILHDLMEKCKNILIKAGIPEENIDINAESKKQGVARDIISEAERGQYDTVVVGRRGLSAAYSFVFGSVSNKIVQHINSRTVWVVE
jgi:nucleotide-binding universal stress UspA family protein